MAREPKPKLRQLTRLAKPWDARHVKIKPGSFAAEYVGHELYVQRILADVGPYSFQVEELIYGDFHKEWTDKNGKPHVFDGRGIVQGCLAAMTLMIDGQIETVREVGDCEHPEGWETQGQRAKDAASDAYKRCAMRFGVGLSLWGKDTPYFLYDLLKTRDTQEGRGENGGQPAGKSDQALDASASLTPANSVAAPTLPHLPLPPCENDVALASAEEES